MEAVWVAGCSSYETSSVIPLLKGCSISAGLFRPGERFRSGDTLILCFSSAPLLGGAVSEDNTMGDASL